MSNQPELNQYLNDLGSAKEYLKTIVVRSAKAVLLLVETRDLFVDDVKQLLNVFTENMNLAMEIKLCFHHHQSEEEMTRVEVIA